MSRLSVV